MCSDVTGQIRIGGLLQQNILHSITYPWRHAVVRIPTAVGGSISMPLGQLGDGDCYHFHP
eukprot:3216554-Pyramimonas_sp.AAC.1